MKHRDKQYIETALELAEQATADGNWPFGAVLVADDEVLATEHSESVTGGGSIAHTELRLAQQSVEEFDAETRAKATLYTSTEPCPMCAGSIYYAGIGRVVYSVPGETFAELSGHGTFHITCEELFERADEPAPSVTGPVLEDQGASLHREFDYSQ